MRSSVGIPERDGDGSVGEGATSGSIGVLIAFGTRLSRETLRIAFEQSGFETTIADPEIATIRRRVERGGIDVAVIAPLIPAASPSPPLSIVPDLVGAAPQVAIVVVSSAASGDFVRVALDGGASGCVHVEDGYDQLVHAVRASHQGAIHIGPLLRDALVRMERTACTALSAREQDVLAFVARGLSNVEIARRLNRSLRTIEADRARIARNLALRTRSDWVTAAVERGIFA